MKQNFLTGLTVAALLALLLLVGRSVRREHFPEPTATSKLTDAVTASPVSPAVTSAAQVRAEAVTGNILTPQDVRWDQPGAEPRFAAFAEWTRRYAQAPTAEVKAALEAEGVALARARQKALADLIQTQPQRALELAVPELVRQSVPDSVRALLEEKINARGDLKVIGVMPLPGDEGEVTSVVRAARIGGEDYQVFTYGQGNQFITRENVPLNGIAVPSSAATAAPWNPLVAPGKLMALNSNPARVLEKSEVVQFKKTLGTELICSVSQQPTTIREDETLIELGGEIHAFCGKLHAEDYAKAGIAAAGLDGSSGVNLPTAESSYTEGRKRMLLMRPVWSDYTGGMNVTNSALTHWQNFSNYMFEMSYGKLVFAPLRQGSDITPNMLLPGLVADYDNDGLGKLYNTCKDVARTNYGYDLSKYDFIYVCTGSKPAASYAGLAYVGGVGFHLANGYFDAAVSSHEYGHNLGLNHAHFWDTASKSTIGSGQNVEYGDNNDPMGGGGSPNSYNSRYKNYLGWIPNSEVADLNALGSGRYRLYALDLNAVAGLRGLKFTRSGSQNYWFNFRQRKTSKKALMNGIQMLWTGNGNEGSYLLDVRLKGGSDDNAVVLGRTFSDTNVNMHVTPIGKGHTFPESMDVVVNVGAFPTNLPPTVVATASPLSTTANQVITFSAAAFDPNGDALAYNWEFGDGDYSIDNSAVTTHSFGADGDYAVQCIVSDMKGGTARHTIIVRVGNPANIFRISGHVLDTKNRAVPGMRVGTSSGKFAYTDSDGSYTIAGLAAGSYTLDALEPVAGALSFAHPNFNNPLTVGPNYTSADFIGVAGSLNIYTPLSPKLANWKYLDDGSDQGTAWQAPAFDDTGWSNGPAILGYGQGGESTIISYGTNASSKYITYYFRRQFVVNNPSAFTNLLLETQRDDGVIVYLNGAEVYRDNMPTGAVTYLTPASSQVEPGTYLQATLSASALVTGTNVITAEVHQIDPGSSDLTFDSALSGLSISNASGFNVVYISSPADHAVFTSPTNVTITATAQGAVAPVTLVEFYANNAKLGDVTTEPYSFTWTNPPNGLHSLKAVGTMSGLLVTSPPISITVTAPLPQPVSLTLIQTGAVWNYFFTNYAAPANWAALNFDDAGWSNGAAKLGYGHDVATTIDGGPSSNRYTTAYFRRKFTISDPSAVTSMTVQLKRDDGVIIYLNGAELMRDNITNGPVTYSTFAPGATDNGLTVYTFTLSPALLINGTNVIAAEVHQTSLTSSDLAFDFGLAALASTNRPVGLYLTSPANGATISLPGNATLAAQVASGALGVTKVDFFSDGAPVGFGNNSPFSLVWSNPPSGAHTITAIATASDGSSTTGAPVNITVTAPPLGTAFVSFGDMWKYLDDGSNQGTNWSRRIFNDSSWMAGPARLGYGGDGELTALSFGTNANSKFITTYFRKSFTVANPSIFNGLLLRLIRDDGAVVFLNGAEIYRDNLQAGPVSWNSLAVTAVDAAAETTPVDVILGINGLLAGTNMLAVEVHQASINSSDLGFDLAFIGLDDTNVVQGVYLTAPANGAHFNSPANVSLSTFATAPAPVTLVEYFAGATKVGQATANPYAATWINPSTGSHILTARATYGAGLTMTSAPVSITVSAPPAPIAPVYNTLVNPGSAWKYWDSATVVGIGWQGTNFDDSAWPSANSRFGWGLDGELTPLTEGRITHYFRRWFTVADAALLSELAFELVRDDGAAVYLNGVEVYRSNLPAGTVTPATLASAAVNTPDETTWFETFLATAGSGLLSGSNLVAVELHQSSATSADGSFDFALYGLGTTERRIYLSTPGNNASYFAPTLVNVQTFARAGTGFNVSKVELFANGIKQSEKTVAPYSFTIGPPAGSNVLVARMTDNTGATMDSAPVTITVNRQLISTTFIPSNSVWKFLDDGSNQGTNWAQKVFNDSSWKMGPARLGFGGDGEVTLVASNRQITTYFRREFVVSAGATYTNFGFKLLRDDGAVVWLNGRELYRSNMTNGPATYLSPAATLVSGTDEQTYFPTNVAITNLPAGTNLIAVEIHQNSATSSDVSFNLELIASGYVEDSSPPLLTAVADEGFVQLSWTANAIGWQVYGAPTVNTPANAWTFISGPQFQANGRNIVTLGPTNAMQFYRLSKP